MTVRDATLLVLALSGVTFAILWARIARRSPVAARRPTLLGTTIGFVTNFFDTLGIGSFATTATTFKALRMVPDELLPGTMLVGHGIPTVAQAIIFIAVVTVDPKVLLVLIAAIVAGGWFGADVVTRLPRRPIQLGMGSGLLLAAAFMAMSQLGLFPAGGTALGLSGGKLAIAVVAATVIGALLMIGIGHYAPCLIVLSVLGMDPRAAFPVMAGAGAMVAMVGGLRFVVRGRYDLRAALGLAVGGIPGTVLAGLVVKSLPLTVLRWVVVGVVAFAAFQMLRSAFAGTLPASDPAPPPAS